MDIKSKVEKGLNNYRRNKCKIETSLKRIEVYEKLLKSGDNINLFIGEDKELGMPRGNTNNIISIVELEILSQEEQRQILKQWIKDDKSRIYPLQIEKEQIDAALGALTERERFIIECKYFEEMFWRDIERNFNEKYGARTYITESGLKKMFYESRDIIIKLLEEYYIKFN